MYETTHVHKTKRKWKVVCVSWLLQDKSAHSSEQGPLEQIAQDHVWAGFKYVKRMATLQTLGNLFQCPITLTVKEGFSYV